MEIRWVQYKNSNNEDENFYPITHIDAIVGINNISKREVVQITLNASNWSNTTPYSQTVAVEGIGEEDVLTVEYAMTATTLEEKKQLQKAWNMVDKIESGNGSVTVYCNFEKPSVNLPLIIRR